MDKVKELVERVRLAPEEITGEVWEKSNAYVCEHGEVPSYKQYVQWGAEAQLNKVLNDPGLALIKGDYLYRYSDGSVDASIIPLAEALKEA